MWTRDLVQKQPLNSQGVALTLRTTCIMYSFDGRSGLNEVHEPIWWQLWWQFSNQFSIVFLDNLLSKFNMLSFQLCRLGS